MKYAMLATKSDVYIVTGSIIAIVGESALDMAIAVIWVLLGVAFTVIEYKYRSLDHE